MQTKNTTMDKTEKLKEGKVVAVETVTNVYTECPKCGSQTLESFYDDPPFEEAYEFRCSTCGHLFEIYCSEEMWLKFAPSEV